MTKVNKIDTELALKTIDNLEVVVQNLMKMVDGTRKTLEAAQRATQCFRAGIGDGDSAEAEALLDGPPRAALCQRIDELESALSHIDIIVRGTTDPDTLKEVGAEVAKVLT